MTDPLIFALLRCPFQLHEQKIFLAIKSLTVDQGLAEAPISSRYLAAMTRIHRESVRRALRQLLRANVIRCQSVPVDSYHLKNILSINAAYQTWKKWPVDKSNWGGSATAPGMGAPQLPEVGAPQLPEVGALQTPGGSATAHPNLKPVLKPDLKDGIKPGANAESRPVDKKKNQKANLKELLHGFEDHITDTDPRELVDHLGYAGFNHADVWTACVQTRKRVNAPGKEKLTNPAGYFVKLLGDPTHALSDDARRQAKEEMRKHGYF